MVGKNGRKILKTKGFRHDRENGLNISKRFFSLHGLTSALRLRGLFFGYSGDCFTSGLQMGLKRPGRVLFSAVWPFYGWVDGFCYMMV
jgi:hypothetical protein